MYTKKILHKLENELTAQNNIHEIPKQKVKSVKLKTRKFGIWRFVVTGSEQEEGEFFGARCQ